ncbi:MAG: substrate-binding domain-containing protein [Sedimentisphaerales bacterium]|nr:substrate-binding domain-containing protein [Sedimentisphaerales bacterium]
MSRFGITLDKENRSEPLYEQIRRQISQFIKTKRLQPGERMPTIAALVREWNVDFSTIKSAFDLLETEGLLELEPRKGARVKNTFQKTYNLLYVRLGLDAYVLDISDGAESYCTETNQAWHCIDTRIDYDKYLQTISHPPKDTDGMLILPLESPECKQAVRKVIDNGIRVIFLDHVLDGISASSVAADNFAGGYRATQHLAETHHLPVFYAGQVDTSSTARDRVKGWAVAMGKHYYNKSDDYIIPISQSDADAQTYKDPLKHPKATANQFFDTQQQEKYCILASDDHVSHAFYLAAQERGLEVGKNVFIMGFNDLPLCRKLEPSLSSVSLPRKEIGYEGAKLLHEELLGKSRTIVNRILPIELKLRQSSLGL